MNAKYASALAAKGRMMMNANMRQRYIWRAIYQNISVQSFAGKNTFTLQACMPNNIIEELIKQGYRVSIPPSGKSTIIEWEV